MNRIDYNDGIKVGLLYCYIHLIIEIICFYVLNTLYKLPTLAWIIAVCYDALAFVPQSLIGYYNDKNRKIDFIYISFILLFISLLLLRYLSNHIYLILIILCLGNCFGHIAGAEKTIRISNGKMTPSSIFIAGGSVGLVIGKILAIKNVSAFIPMILIITTIPFILYQSCFNEINSINSIDYCKKNVNKAVVILFSVIIVAVRSYIGYGIPTSWKKNIFEDLMFYIFMALGKMLGGILIDYIGIKKTTIISMLFSIPFLLFGDKIMVLSIIGVMFFSMSMSITLALIVSALKKTPGLAFGITTISLFIGSIPLFFYKIVNTKINIVMIIILSLLSLCMCLYIIEDNQC